MTTCGFSIKNTCGELFLGFSAFGFGQFAITNFIILISVLVEVLDSLCPWM